MKKRYQVVNVRNGQVVGQAQSLKAARRIVDRKDNEYGAYVHVIRNQDWKAWDAKEAKNGIDGLNDMMGDWFN